MESLAAPSCLPCLCLLDDHVELAHAIRTYAVALVLDRILYVAAEDACRRILFENDFVAVYKDFNRIFTILNVDLRSSLGRTILPISSTGLTIPIDFIVPHSLFFANRPTDNGSFRGHSRGTKYLVYNLTLTDIKVNLKFNKL